MNATDAPLLTPSVETAIGNLRTIGTIGPAYEVTRALRQLSDGDWLMEIIVLESGEVTEYPLSSIQEDPLAA